ncbi:hypothetical protein [Ulvibacter antarcticus]|uniref:Trimeric autotransporter adhesin n=1 Tax=Ulvibacter antarcticus TaxID=442714 RepID=A0A3L9YKZ6_9FLAO|nr:hypothetical protein [Ulvibacter antarcticus]RMA58815.1 trimeric autotransporter adhesin [Ulvibacter antarcticus]
MTNNAYLFFFLIICLSVNAQVGIGIANPKSSLDIVASNFATPSNTDGILIPRLQALPAINPTDAQHSMLIYLSTASGTYIPGFHFWDKNKGVSGEWVPILNKPGWEIDGNSNTTSGVHFLGTTNAEEVDFKVNNKLIGRLTELGQFELQADGESVLIGYEAGENYDPANTLADHNVYIGYQAAKQSTSGRDNTAVGAFVMIENTTGSYNTALGSEALQTNTIGEQNTALGDDALRYNTIGNDNTAVGQDALKVNAAGQSNTAVGRKSLRNNIGDNNVALGSFAGESITTGNNNSVLGYAADVVVGTEIETVIIGNGARGGANRVVAIGKDATASQTNAVAIGNNATASATNATAIGNGAVSNNANEMVLGNNSVTRVITSGSVRANSFISNTTTYPDYVFEDFYTGSSEINSDYKFTDLENAEKFVKANGHLPGVKSYEAVANNNFELNITETSVKNLEKIEEQFLYIVTLNEKIKDQENSIEDLKQEVEALKAIVQKLISDK